MADFAPNFTNRYRIKYSTMGRNHSIVFRAGTTAAPLGPLIEADAKAFLDALANFRFSDWSVLGAEYSEAGSSFFLPAPTPVIAPGAATIGGSGRGVVNANFQGVSLSEGSRASLYVYGVNADPITTTETQDSNYRITRAEYAIVAAALDALAAATELTAIDGGQIIWHQYANINVNSYWQRKARG